MYKTLTISSVVMILAFSGYVSEATPSKVSISIEIDFPEEKIEKDTSLEKLEVEILEKGKFEIKEEEKRVVVPGKINEQILITSYVKSYKPTISLLIENDQKYGLLVDTKYLLDRYFDLLKKEEETKLREQRIERQKLFWQHDKYIEYQNGIRGIYINGYLYGSNSFKEQIHSLVLSTDLNAVVLSLIHI